jgi:xanthine dehydrogenase accessory factor
VRKQTAILAEAARLAAEGEAFALATVVSVRRPASARVGDRGLVTGEGELHGWVGGACSEPIVVRQALLALADGQARLVRVCPPGEKAHAPPGVVVAHSHCASEGVVDVLVEPELPAPLLSVVGESPAATTLAALAETIGWRVAREPVETADAVVVATMGHGDEDALERALDAGTGYVALVASSKRAATVLGSMRQRGVSEESLAHVRSPAGLDLGPSSQEEIAVAVLAELVAWRHTRVDVTAALVEAIDPVCGMTVAVSDTTPSSEHDGTTYFFCGQGCRARFESDPVRYLIGTT